MYEQIGRMTVPPEQLNQWTFNLKQLTRVITNLLGLTCDIRYKAEQKSITLGALKSKEAGRKSVVLNVESLSLLVNQSVLPINDILYFDLNSSNKLKLDKDKIDHVLNLKQAPAVKNYRANTDKKELRKANTLAMHEDWQEQAIKLKNKHPTKSKKWISQQIAKLLIAQGKSTETIRKNTQI